MTTLFSRPTARRRIGLAVRAVLGVIGVMFCLGSSCDWDPSPIKAFFKPVDDGTSLEVSWFDERAGEMLLSARIFYLVGTETRSIKVPLTEYETLAVPSRTVWVVGLNNQDEATEAVFYECPAVVTSGITLYPVTDTLTPGHEAHGLYFDTYAGTAFGMPYSNNLGRLGSTFVLVSSGDTLFLQSAKDVIFRGSGWSPSSGGKGTDVGEDFVDLTSCPGPGAGWVSKLRIQEGETYALDAVRSDTSRFVKLKVEDIEGNAATFKVAVQKKALLRWVVTN